MTSGCGQNGNTIHVKDLSDQGISHPLLPKEELNGTPIKKTIFPTEFCDDYYTLKKKKKRNKMAAKRLIFVLRHFDFGENLKNHFSKRIVQWNLTQNRNSWIY